MRTFWLILVLTAFGLGFCMGAAVERRYYHVSEDRLSLVYEGSVYVRAVEGTTLEDYLTAAGKK